MEKRIKTKDKILLTAIKQYNQTGIQGVTSRHIAAEMGISHGNLDYHYKTKEDIILAIYNKMRDEMSESYTSRKDNSSSIEHLHLLLIHLEEFQDRYKFFNLDVLEISRSFPTVNKLLQQTIELRKHQMETFFKEFLTDEYLIAIETDILENIQHNIRIIITFWLSQREVLATEKFTEKGAMVKSIWAMINPYLTEKGKEEYLNTIGTYGYLKHESNINE